MSLEGTISGTQRLSGNVIPRGNDGISPTIDIAPIEGGTRVTITDINGTKQFDVLGSISKEQIEELIRENLENNPPDFNESDPTVPAWAKQATKPKYTAEEVGALPVNSLQPAINEALAQAKASGEFDDLAIVNDGKGSVVTINDSINRPLRGLTLYGKTTQNITLGKNLFNAVAWFESHGFTKQEDGSWLCKQISEVCWTNTEKIKGSMYITAIAKKDTTAIPLYFQVFYTDGTRDSALELRSIGEFVTLTAKSNSEKTVDYIRWTYSSAGEYYLKGVMFSFIDNEYEPYTNGVASPSPDYPAELVNAGASGAIHVTVTDGTEADVQNLNVSTPNGLPGVPVSSGGNYTDENGRQWICDEIDFAKGMYVKRTDTVDMGTLHWGMKSAGLFFTWSLKTAMTNGILCDKYVVGHHDEVYETPQKDMAICVGGSNGSRFIGLANSNFSGDVSGTATELAKSLIGTTLLYSLLEPIETPLSAEEIEAYKALHTNKPNTTIYNDAGAGLNVKYVADTKSYVDNKFNMLVSAIVNNA